MTENTRKGHSFLVPAFYVNLMAILGLVSLWDIYRHPWFFVVVAGALTTANGLAVLKLKTKLSWGKFWVLALVAYVILGVLTAAPSIYGESEGKLTLLFDILLAPLSVWKQILTLEIPLGTYQVTLTPLTLLVLVFAAFPLALFQAKNDTLVLSLWRSMSIVFLPWGILFFGIVLGSGSQRSVGSLPFSLELFLGLLAFLATLLFVSWLYDLNRERSGPKRRNSFFATGLVVSAVIVSLLLSPTVLAGVVRDVPRTATHPQIQMANELHPLVAYRNFFSDEYYEAPIFEFLGETRRFRLAVMQNYDGEALSVTAAEADLFVRTPATLTLRDRNSESMQIKTINWSDIWVPLAGDLRAINFTGAQKGAMEDSFYLHAASGTGVELSESRLEHEISYTFFFENDSLELSEITPDIEPTDKKNVVGRMPHLLELESLNEWVTAQAVTDDLHGFLEAVERLRERGFLSRAFIEQEEELLWAKNLTGYQFQPSRSGHSIGRVDKLFSDLNEREQSFAGDGVTLSSEFLVATSGDEEQFATAVKLLADHFGFNSRVVLGVDTAGCSENICAGKDILAWVEVEVSDGDSGQTKWLVIDVTPQWKNSPVLGLTEVADPQNVTNVEHQEAAYVPPAPPTPAADLDREEPEQNESLPVSYWETIQVVSLLLLPLVLLFSPLVTILWLKAIRRRRRLKSSSPREKIIAGWSEYVDALTDLGVTYSANKTRSEYARSHSINPASAKKLAFLADMADFSGNSLTEKQAEQFWDAVENEKQKALTELSLKNKIRYKFSVRSLKQNKTRNNRSIQRGGSSGVTAHPYAKPGRRARPSA